MNREAGDIYLDEKNNVVYVNHERGFQQIIDGLFHCDVGSEVMNPSYGFDLQLAMREGSVEDSELFIESLVSQALSGQNEKLISKVDYVKAERQQADREMHVDITVSSILDDQINTELTIGSVV